MENYNRLKESYVRSDSYLRGLRSVVPDDLRTNDETSFESSLIRNEHLHNLFEEQVDARRQRVAVECGDERLTYADLDSRANQLARYLSNLRIMRNSYVAILLERSPEVYVAMLAVLKTGAAYVPLDPDYPADRIRYILEDCNAQAILTTSSFAAKLKNISACIVCIDEVMDALQSLPKQRISERCRTATPYDVCYVIYTSGTTGRPKGVQIEHRNVCHFVRAEGRIFNVQPEDRVYQGLSIAFDASIEEMWLAFFAGATLVVGTREMAQSGPDLARHLNAAGVTVVSTVPTIFSMLEEEIPTLRLLIFGGEPCPQDLVRRWWNPQRRIFNTYGPTEATVVATFTECHPDKPVTIGRPLPNYGAYILDENFQEVPRGSIGELYLDGIGIARGYIGKPELTREKFIVHQFNGRGDSHRLYKTGDRVRWGEVDELEFLGRIDSQVKLRGYRIELAEIESILLESSRVKSAAVAVRQDNQGLDRLVGYIVPRGRARPDDNNLRSLLRTKVPAFMVPSHFETLRELPVLPSGKIDRSALPCPDFSRTKKRRSFSRPRSSIEKKLLSNWETFFAPAHVSLTDDFFLNLGGHSLLAARMVSALRNDNDFKNLSVLDVYQYPTIRKLAAKLESDSQIRGKPSARSEKKQGHYTPGRVSHFFAGAMQSFGLYFVFGFRAAEWVTPYLVYFLLLESGSSILSSAVWAAVSLVAIFPLLALIAIAVKWVVLGHIKPGRYPLWDWYYLRWWFVQMFVSALPIDYLAGTPLLPFFYRLLGAKIGNDVYIGTENLAAFDLISIGDNSCIDDEASLLGYTVEDGHIIIDSITIGCRCFVGTRSVLREGTIVEDDSRLEDLSLVLHGMRVPRGENWAGSPARKVNARKGKVSKNPPVYSPFQKALIAILYAMLAVVIPFLPVAAFVPGMAVLTILNPILHPILYVMAAPVVGASFVLLLTIEVVLFKWLLVGRVREGTYPVHGSFYIRKWIVDQLLALSLDVIAPIHATLYLPVWYRALGAKLGRLVELSTVSSATPDLLEIGDGGTIADEVSLGAGRVENGWMSIASTSLGRRAFVGNSGVIPAGTNLGDETLVGVLSLAPPPGTNGPAQKGASWLGSPPLLLPRRQPSEGFKEERTYEPPRKLVMTRALVELFRITLPPAGFIFVTATVVLSALALLHQFGFLGMLALLPVVYACCSIVVGVLVIAMKWIIIGRYKPFICPLWNNLIWRLEFINALYEFLATPLLLETLQGTPMLLWYFRLLGANVGRGVYTHTTGLLEWDLVTIGDHAALNDDCVLQTHLFEDRILKASELRVGSYCTVGAVSIVLYDSAMKDGSKLDALSLLMKGETLPEDTAWVGIPASHETEESPQSKYKVRKINVRLKKFMPDVAVRKQHRHRISMTKLPADKNAHP